MALPKPGMPAFAPRGLSAQIDPQKAEEIRVRIRNLNLLSFALALPGIAIQVVGRVAFEPAANGVADPQKEFLSAVLILVGACLVMAGLGCYAKMKGRSGAWGLMGLLSFIGLLVLACIGKRCQNCEQQAGANAKQCAFCHGPL